MGDTGVGEPVASPVPVTPWRRRIGVARLVVRAGGLVNLFVEAGVGRVAEPGGADESV